VLALLVAGISDPPRHTEGKVCPGPRWEVKGRHGPERRTGRLGPAAQRWPVGPSVEMQGRTPVGTRNRGQMKYLTPVVIQKAHGTGVR